MYGRNQKAALICIFKGCAKIHSAEYNKRQDIKGAQISRTKVLEYNIKFYITVQ